MSIFGTRHRLQEANVENNGGGGAEWLKPFGEHAKVFEGIKDPGELATKYTAANTELAALKAKPSTFDFRKELIDEKALGADAEKASKFLGRFTDKGSFIKSVLEAQGALSQRDAHKPLAKDAKPEEVTAWRTANGIPNEVKGYFEKLPDGLVIGKDDQPFMDAWGKSFLENNVPPATAHKLIKQYYDGVAAMQVEEAKVDRADSLKAVTELRAKMGPEYETNMSILNSWIDGMPEDLKANFKDATLGDGTRLFNSAGALEFLMKAARELNPAAHLIPPGGEANMLSIDTELDSIKGLMADKNSKYWKGAESEKLQKRYRDLVTAQQHLKRK